MIHAIKDNSLSIVLFALFVICMFAQSFAGWRLQNETLAAHGQALIGYWHNLSTGTFLEGLASNWQAAFLQLASLIRVQQLSSISAVRRIHAIRSRGKTSKIGAKKLAASPGSTAIRCSWRFCCCLCSRLRCMSSSAPRPTTRNAALMGQPPISIAAFLLSAKFWSSTLQTWQAEYLAIASLCRAQHLSASAGFGGIEAGRIEGRNNRRGEQVNDTPPCLGHESSCSTGTKGLK